MKYILFVLLIILFSSFSFRSEKKSKRTEKTVKNTHIERIDVDGEKFKQDILDSIYEFIKVTNSNPDSCYIPFKKEEIK